MGINPETTRKTLRHRHAEAVVNLIKRRRWFDSEGDSDGENDPADDEPTPKPDTTPGGKSGQDGDTFTQEQVNRIVGKRAKEASERAVKDLLGGLGLDSVDDLSTLIKSVKEREEAELTEVQKAQKAKEAAEKAAADAKAQLETERQARLTDKRNSAVLAAATAANALDPKDVLRWAAAEGASHNAPIDDVLDAEGSISQDAIEAIIKAAKKEKSNYFQSGGPGSPSHSGGKPPSGGELNEKALEGLPKLSL